MNECGIWYREPMLLKNARNMVTLNATRLRHIKSLLTEQAKLQGLILRWR